MSSDLEKFIRKNRDDFDDADPSNKVWKNMKNTGEIHFRRMKCLR